MHVVVCAFQVKVTVKNTFIDVASDEEGPSVGNARLFARLFVTATGLFDALLFCRKDMFARTVLGRTLQARLPPRWHI